MSAERFSLDANVLFYAIDVNEKDRHERAMEIVDAAVDVDCVLTLQALCEFFASATRKGKMTVAEASAQIVDWQTLFATIYPSSSTLPQALDAVARHNLSFWDAMIWSVARQAGVTMLLSEDFQHDRVLGGVRFHDPFSAGDPFKSPIDPAE